MPSSPAPATAPAAPNTDPSQDKKLTETRIAISIASLINSLTAPADPRAPAWTAPPADTLGESDIDPGYSRRASRPHRVPFQPENYPLLPPSPPDPGPAPPAPAPPQSSNISNERAADMLTGGAIGLTVAQVLLLLL